MKLKNNKPLSPRESGSQYQLSASSASLESSQLPEAATVKIKTRRMKVHQKKMMNLLGAALIAGATVSCERCHDYDNAAYCH